MKIIKEGKTKEELEKILKNTKRFKCKTCGCIFEANDNEYIYEEDYIYATCYCKCPNCGQNAFEVKMR
jgi:Zn finger protein HypA/HybF involved in hydrogenase expression